MIFQIDPEKEKKEKEIADSLSWPTFLEQMKKDKEEKQKREAHSSADMVYTGKFWFLASFS